MESTQGQVQGCQGRKGQEGRPAQAQIRQQNSQGSKEGLEHAHGRRISSRRRRIVVAGLVGGPRILRMRPGPGQGQVGRRKVRHGHSSSQRYREFASGSRPDGRRGGYVDEVASDEGTRESLRSRHRSRGNRHPIGRRKDAHEGREQEPSRSGTRKVHRKGVGMEGRLRQSHHHPAPFPRLQRRLEPGTIHHGRSVQPRGVGGVQSIPREGFAVPGGTIGELELRAQVGHFGH
mmetsp:Transcript_38279/g.114617  ORF Transcript_38279/g.114617 Transcript_38279/m.114617 type:complete len:233 (-) Transcript_38279:266-964(-)